MGLQGFDQAGRADAFAHPGFQEGLSSAPEVQIRIKLTPQAFHIQQGFLQQYQLRLHFHVEAPRRLEQP